MRAPWLAMILALPCCARLTEEDVPSERAALRCLPNEIAAGYFSELAPEMCVVAKYEVPPSATRSTAAFSWGAHDGLLAGPEEVGAPTLVRYGGAASNTGALAPGRESIEAAVLPAGARWLPRAIDLAVGSGALISYAPAKYDVGDGEVFVVRDGAVVSRRHVPGASYFAAMHAEDRTLLLHSGYGPLSSEATPDDRAPTPGVYVSIACTPSGELPPADGCSPTAAILSVPREECCNSRPTLVGPVAIDPDGNAFATIVYRSTFTLGTGQAQIVGLAKSAVTSSSVVRSYSPLHNLDISDMNLQLGADGTKLCVDHALSTAPVIECVRYRASGSSLAAVGRSFPLLRKSETVDPRSAVIVDRQRRFWIGFGDRTADAAALVRAFFVLSSR